MDNTSNIDMNTSNIDVVVGNTSNIIVMTNEMCVVKCMTQEKNNMRNTIEQQSAEIGKLLGEVQLWKLKYEQIFANII